MKPKTSVYIHIPFCRSKCVYCDFASFADIDHLMGPYLEALLIEIGHEHPLDVNTVYLGGGTPSHLPVESMERIMAAVKAKFHIDSDAEMTIEVNPRSATPDTLKSYRQMGFNRLSIGVQSFDDAMLKRLGRVHSAQDARDTVVDARNAGFNNLSIDLIHGIPGQSLEMAMDDLAAAVSLSPEHLSVYQLTVEEDTPLWDLVEDGKLELPEDGLQLSMYESAIGYLKGKGFAHYEVSNFAKPGNECLHNLAYWVGDEFLGLGSGAHSFIESVRYANPEDPEHYIRDVAIGGTAAVEIHADEPDKIIDYFLMRLRLVDKSLDFETVNRKFGINFSEKYEKALKTLERQGLIRVSKSGFTQTHKGLLFLDDVLLELDKVC